MQRENGPLRQTSIFTISYLPCNALEAGPRSLNKRKQNGPDRVLFRVASAPDTGAKQTRTATCRSDSRLTAEPNGRKRTFGEPALPPESLIAERDHIKCTLPSASLGFLVPLTLALDFHNPAPATVGLALAWRIVKKLERQLFLL